MGWTAHFDAAARTAITGDRRHTSGGVAIFVRSLYATRRVTDLAVTHPGRAIAVEATLPHISPCPVVLVSAYLQTSTGMADYNLDLLSNIAPPF